MVMGFTVISFNLYAFYNKFVPFVMRAIGPSILTTKYATGFTLLLDQGLFAPYMCVSYLYFISMLEVR